MNRSRGDGMFLLADVTTLACWISYLPALLFLFFSLWGLLFLLLVFFKFLLHSCRDGKCHLTPAVYRVLLERGSRGKTREINVWQPSGSNSRVNGWTNEWRKAWLRHRSFSRISSFGVCFLRSLFQGKAEALVGSGAVWR